MKLNEKNDKICHEDLHEFPITSNGYIKLKFLVLISIFIPSLKKKRNGIV